MKTTLALRALANDRRLRVLDWLKNVNFSAGRVRPSLAIDLSAAVDLYKKESRALRLQGDIRNLNDRLNLINFASVFSGTAIAPPRTFSLRVRFDY